MSDKFRDREKGYEAKYKLDEELKFKAESRRNKLLGLWAAERMGISGDEAAAYAKEVVVSDLEEPGVEDVVRKVSKDFKERGVGISDGEIRDQLGRLYGVALEQLSKEYPEALGPDHEPVGG